VQDGQFSGLSQQIRWVYLLEAMNDFVVLIARSGQPGGMDELLQKISKLETLLEAAMTRIAELEAKGQQDSGNSSKPPSSDLGRKRKPPVDPSGRKRGGESLEQAPRLDAFLPQVTETPWCNAFVMGLGFRLWLKACPKCGKTTRGQILWACRTALSAPNARRGSACSVGAIG
jgi:hypothetical protein